MGQNPTLHIRCPSTHCTLLQLCQDTGAQKRRATGMLTSKMDPDKAIDHRRVVDYTHHEHRQMPYWTRKSPTASMFCLFVQPRSPTIRLCKDKQKKEKKVHQIQCWSPVPDHNRKCAQTKCRKILDIKITTICLAIWWRQLGQTAGSDKLLRSLLMK